MTDTVPTWWQQGPMVVPRASEPQEPGRTYVVRGVTVRPMEGHGFVALSPDTCPVQFATEAATEAAAVVEWWNVLGALAFEGDLLDDEDDLDEADEAEPSSLPT